MEILGEMTLWDKVLIAVLIFGSLAGMFLLPLVNYDVYDDAFGKRRFMSWGC